MTLFIQDDPGTVGSGTVLPGNVSLHLMAIGNVENNDADYGENPLPDPSHLIQVTFALNTGTGACPTRLNDLVNTNFNVNPEDIDIIIVGSDGSFTLNDGEMLANVGGVSLSPGETHNGINFNPTTSVVVVYESTGGTNCVKGEASGDYDAPNPSSTIVYHELSHARRQATNSSLDGSASGCDTSDEERAAEVDENDMRDQIGVPRRDVGDHCGDPGCGTCCIVATIASGSGYSAEVNALRQIRDRHLRRSDVGFDFFDQLHREYYTFSPQVCGMMGGSPELTNLIRVYFVRPLTLCLDLVQAHTIRRVDPEELAAQFETGLSACPDLLALSADDLRQALDVLSSNCLEFNNGATELEERARALSELLRARAGTSPSVKWALIETIEIYIKALMLRLEGTSNIEMGEFLAREFDAWAPNMPLTAVWQTLSMYATSQELAFLNNVLLRNEQTRFQFGRRLISHMPENEKLARVLVDAGFAAKGFKS